MGIWPAPLSCAITTFGGITDPEVSQIELAAWQQHTTGEFSLQMLPGNHFFIHEHCLQFLDLLSQHIAFQENRANILFLITFAF
ncbi:thioesterase II family protein [Anabaena sp. FACHB-709]|uniref:Thioesterase n=2 Tax=Nostocaceae TaxID=1162 RepID=A0A1Z4KH24_ANAVA|nr:MULTISPECIES: thioesterase domain-containing protein [Nostocaceae]BAY68278.1 hypothetical protein NIES23_10620 [Trichormus variabilis NIES-23]HBW33518.1 hypothetical protein [Nostoc sp. UBA8866]MBD2169647.1 hypothetical protein [Anabaena cylindrica FACHB-318]MBD2261934.1 hypothetical protein [Anabaena sp. FACHB-709]MBD2271519.1 hypothetical protein [Nostoc sp. PCC 7120 = FACHB-418]